VSDPISRLNVVLESRYRIERELGEGGMATVYLAHDLKHDRKVAIKVLKPELSAVLGAARFLTEIRTTANLTHPNVLPLHDSGEVDGVLYYITPFLEGESLRDRLEREGELPVDDAVRIAKGTARALEHAHRNGVIHRDVKPANILLQDGEPVVADFGIALAVGAAGGGRLTETGLSLGTPLYMSPEQVTGDQEPSPQSDVYSLGCVLYEMLVGEPPYVGSSAQTVLGKILTGDPEPPIDRRRAIPLHVEAVCLKALQRRPADRFASAAQVAQMLDDSSFRFGLRGVDGHGVRRWRVATAVSLAAAAIATAFALAGRGGTAADNEVVVQFDVDLPAGYNSQMWYPTLAMSPDGSRLAFVGDVGPNRSLYVRALDRADVIRLPVEGRPEEPFFSTDGEWIGFWDGRRLGRVSIRGDEPVTMATLSTMDGASSSPDGSVIFAHEGLWRVPAAGGEPVLIPGLESRLPELLWPDVLPDARHALVTMRFGERGPDSLGIVDLADGSLAGLGLAGGNARYSATGHIVFGAAGGVLLAAPFDVRARRITGPAVTVTRDAAVTPANVTQFAVSRTGTLAFAADTREVSRLARVSRESGEIQEFSDPGVMATPRVSPDGRRVAVSLFTRDTSDVWIHDSGTGTFSRLTYGGFSWPAWSPDGTRLAFVSSGPKDLFVQSIEAVGGPQLLRDGVEPIEDPVFTRDGSGVVYAEGSRGTRRDLWYLPLSGGEPRAIVASPADEQVPAISYDGRWVAYLADESGDMQVYVTALAEGGPRWQISTNGGTEPVWSPTALELFYRTADGPVVAQLREGAGLEVVRREPVAGPDDFDPDRRPPEWDVYPDGKSFVTLSGATNVARLTVVVHRLRRLTFNK